MALRPWEAQEKFCHAIEEVKAPIAVNVIPQSQSIVIEWNKRPGKISNFLILLGASVEEVLNQNNFSGRTIKDTGFNYREEISNLENGKEYYIAVVAEKDGKTSQVSEIWKAIPNSLGKIRPAEKVVIENREGLRFENSESLISTNKVPEVLPEQVVQVSSNVVALCAACSGDVILSLEKQVYVCQGCGAEFVQRVSDNIFINLTSLLNGICSCCSPRRPLILPPNASYRRCSQTGEQYVEITKGNLVQLSNLDYGLCTCCQPANPLILNHQGQIVCGKRRDRLYIEEAGRYKEKPPEAPLSLVDDIDAALSDGSAIMLPGGILTSGKKRSRKPRNQS